MFPLLLTLIAAQTAGLKVELRPVAGSAFEEVRVSGRSSLGLEALCDAVWAKNQAGKKPEGNFKKRVVISETATERWTYEQIRVPVVADRDYVIAVKLVQPATSGRCEVAFETRTHPKFPEVSDHVRIPSIRGNWTLTPAGAGQVDVSYVVFSDPGGSVPALFARKGQREAAVDFFKVILARAAR